MDSEPTYVQMAIIYKNPEDHPGKFVVREWRVGAEGAPEAAVLCELFDTASQAQAFVRSEFPDMELIQEGDDPESCVFEVWRCSGIL
jgi:hypothetical protein